MTRLPPIATVAPVAGAAPISVQGLLKSKQVCEVLQISARSLWTATEAGHIRSVRLGRSVRYDPKDVQAFIEFKKVGGYHQRGCNGAPTGQTPASSSGGGS